MDGRDDEGRIVPDGSYRPRLTLESGARSFVLRNPIQLDTRAPKMTVTRVSPKVFSPDGDGRNDQVVVRYRVDEPGCHGILRVDGVRRVYTLFKPLEGAMTWNGKRKGGRPLPAGVHRLVAAAVDEAETGKAQRPIFVTIRYIELARTTIPVLARTRFGVRVSTDAKTFRWWFAGRTGVGRPGLLILRAPGEGRYLLFVEANKHAPARASSCVRVKSTASRSPTATR